MHRIPNSCSCKPQEQSAECVLDYLPAARVIVARLSNARLRCGTVWTGRYAIFDVLPRSSASRASAVADIENL